MNEQEILREISVCTRCSLHKTADLKVPGRGDTTADIVIVGIGPGPMENKQGTAFVGDSGRVLESALAEIKADYDYSKITYYLTNLIRCAPWKDKSRGQVRDPSQDEIDSCASFLDAELNMINPKLVIALGEVPMHAFGRRAKMAKVRGRVFDGKWLNRSWPVLPTWHPAHIVRSGPGQASKDFYKDLRLGFFIVHELKYLKYSNTCSISSGIVEQAR